MMNYKGYLIFLFASLAISIGLQLVLPFPYGLGAALAIFIVFPLLLRKRYMTRMGGLAAQELDFVEFYSVKVKDKELVYDMPV